MPFISVKTTPKLASRVVVLDPVSRKTVCAVSVDTDRSIVETYVFLNKGKRGIASRKIKFDAKGRPTTEKIVMPFLVVDRKTGEVLYHAKPNR